MRVLELGEAGGAGEGQDIADIGDAGDVHDKTLEAETEAGVTCAAEAPQVEVPPVVLLIESNSAGFLPASAPAKQRSRRQGRRCRAGRSDRRR